ncbi:MAG: ABC transporter substrate-binding protein [Waddliaceae bacterium]
MKKEPLFLYFLRFIFALGMFAFMGMLYWSSLLLEDRVEKIQADVNRTHSAILELQEKIDLIPQASQSIYQPTDAANSRPHIDKSLPNLLKEDPFYQETLPGILGKNFRPHGTFHYAVLRKPENLHPFSNWSEVNTFKGLSNASVGSLQFGFYEKFSPGLAIKMEARPFDEWNNPEYWIHLRDDIYWEPLSNAMFEGKVNLSPFFLQKHPVTAHDFKFYFDAMMNPHNQEGGAVAIRTYFSDIDEIRVIDDKTFVVRWKTEPFILDNGTEVRKIKYLAEQRTVGLYPLPSFIYKHFEDGTKIIEDDSREDAYRTNSVWGENFSNHWAKNIIPSCGPWIFSKMTDQEISFRRNPDSYNPLSALGQRTVYSFKNSPDSMWQSFKSGQLTTHTLNPKQMIDLEDFLNSDFYQRQKEEGKAIRQLEYLVRSYFYIGWNQAKPFFKSKKVRQALTMAIDRKRIIDQFLNGLGVEITSPFFIESTSYDHTLPKWPYDPNTAKRLLEEEGWFDREGDGVIEKIIDGKPTPFRFTITYFVKDPLRKAIAEYIATALKQVGIECNLNGVDLADFSAEFEDKSFDAMLAGWVLGTPPDDPKQLWHSSLAKEAGSSNHIGFADLEADRIIEKLQYESDPEERVKLYHQFSRIIYDEQPYTLLFTSKAILLYRENLGNVFVPKERQDLIPGATVTEPSSSIFYFK